MANRIHNSLTFHGLTMDTMTQEMAENIIIGYTDGFDIYVYETEEGVDINFTTLNASAEEDVDEIAKDYPEMKLTYTETKITYTWHEEMPLYVYERVYEHGECVSEKRYGTED